MQDIGIPIKWTQVEDTSWYKVETSKDYTYYYNRCTKESSWDKSFLEGNESKRGTEEDVLEEKVLEDDVKAYRKLIEELKFENNVQYEQALPRLLYDERFQMIPKTHRRRLFNSIRRDLIQEKSRGVDIAAVDKHSEDTDLYKGVSVVKGEDRVKEDERLVRKRRRMDDKVREMDESSAKRKYEHAKSLAETSFINLLHEKIKMPFYNGRVIHEVPVELINSDFRFNSEYLTKHDKRSIYQKFTRDFLRDRLSLFESKLKELNYNHLKCTLDEVVKLVGHRLFQHLPLGDLSSAFKRWKDSVKGELMESFNLLLHEKLGDKFSSMEDLDEIKLLIEDDDRYFEDVMSNYKSTDTNG